MPLLPEIPPQCVKKGWWVNFTAPAYRQRLWTLTNGEAVLIVGLLGILGTISSQKSWSITRYYLQPALQLSDPESKRNNLSKTDALKALWANLKRTKKMLKNGLAEEPGCRQKINIMLDVINGNRDQTLHPCENDVESRFGVFAIMNIIIFAVMGIFIPFALAEGLQGVSVVQATIGSLAKYNGSSQIVIDDELVYAHVKKDLKTCVSNEEAWRTTRACTKLRNGLPLYNKEDLNLTNPAFDDPLYHSLVQYGDSTHTALRLTRNTSVRDVFSNTKEKARLQHELICTPISIQKIITPLNGSISLNVEDLIPFQDSRFFQFIRKSVIVRVPELSRFGDETQPKARLPKTVLPRNTLGDQTEAYYRNIPDFTLPYIVTQNLPYELRSKSRAQLATIAVNGVFVRKPLQNFVITMKPASPQDQPKTPSDDSNSAQGTRHHTTHRGVSALLCTELFKVCSTYECKKQRYLSSYSSHDKVLMDWYPGIMSVWASAILDSFYDDASAWVVLENRQGFIQRPKEWQVDLEQRFILSMLRVRHASKHLAEQILLGDNEDQGWNNPLIYGSPDYTNINVWGFIATACAYLYIIAGSYWFVLFWPLAHPLKSVSAIANACLKMYKISIAFGKRSNRPDGSVSEP